MPYVDEEFVDYVFNHVSDDLRRLGTFSNGLLDSIDKQFNTVAESLRGTLQSSPWVPEQIKPPPPPLSAAASALERTQTWVDRNRALTAAIVAFVGTGTFIILRERRRRRAKRRAKRAASGAKTEVVILAGSPYSQLTQSLATDFEKRGFLVFIPVSSVQEETSVAELRLSDVRPLNFDITSDDSKLKMLDAFSSYLANPQRHGTTQLHLASLVISDADASSYPTGAIKVMSPSLWLDSINSHVLYPISLIHTFLPLLAPEKSRRSALSERASIVLITQSNTPSIDLPAHATESLSSAALTSYTQTLQAELPPHCHAVHIRLGAFAYEGKQPPARTVRSGRFVNAHSPPGSISAQRTRELHLAAFDAITGRSQGTVFVGPGARTYALLGALAPRSLVLWMMGASTKNGLLSGRRLGDWWPQSQSEDGSSSESDSIGRSIEWERVSTTKGSGEVGLGL